MSAYVEVRVQGGGRALIEANSIIGVVTHPGVKTDVEATEDAPISVVIRGGNSIPVSAGSPQLLLVRCVMIRKRLRDEGKDIVVDFLDPTPPEASSGEVQP